MFIQVVSVVGPCRYLSWSSCICKRAERATTAAAAAAVICWTAKRLYPVIARRHWLYSADVEKRARRIHTNTRQARIEPADLIDRLVRPYIGDIPQPATVPIDRERAAAADGTDGRRQPSTTNHAGGRFGAPDGRSGTGRSEAPAAEVAWRACMTSRRGVIREPFYQSPQRATDRPPGIPLRLLPRIDCESRPLRRRAATESEVGWSGG